MFSFAPIPTENGLYPLDFGVYENKLEGHFVIQEESGSHFIGVWVMEEVACESGKSWSVTQKYRTGPLSFSLNPVCIWRNEIVCRDEKFGTVLDGDPRRILHLFNFITNEGRKFNCSATCDHYDVFNYEKSLVSVWNAQVE